MTERLTTKRRYAGIYNTYLDGKYIGEIYRDFWTANDPWRFCPSASIPVYSWKRLVGPYTTKRDALATLRHALAHIPQPKAA